MDSAHFNVVTKAHIYKNDALDESGKKFHSDYSGLIGIQPYTADEVNKSKREQQRNNVQ